MSCITRQFLHKMQISNYITIKFIFEVYNVVRYHFHFYIYLFTVADDFQCIDLVLKLQSHLKLEDSDKESETESQNQCKVESISSWHQEILCKSTHGFYGFASRYKNILGSVEVYLLL